MNPLDDRAKYVKNHGCGQDDRHQQALDSDYFKIDDWNLAQFTDLAVKFSENIAFYNGQGQLDGNWSAFFKNDPNISLIRLWAFDTEDLRTRYQRLRAELTLANQKGEVQDKLRDIQVLFIDALKRLDRLYNNLAFFSDLQKSVERSIAHDLAPILRTVMAYDAALGNSPELHNYRIEFGGLWFDGEFHYATSIPKREDLPTLRRIEGEVDELFFQFMREMSGVKAIAKQYFDTKLRKTGEVEPHVAMFIAFSQLYGYAAKRVNDVTRKHLDHYYRDILGIQPRPNEADNVHVNFKLNAGVGKHDIKKGTQLSAGTTDEGEEIKYKTERDLFVTETEITRALGVDTETPGETVLANRELDKSRYYLPTTYKVGEQGSESATELGFAIASSSLELEEGYRKVSLQVKFEKSGIRRLNYQVRQTGQEAFEEQMAACFSIAYTTADGWQRIRPEHTEIEFVRDEAGALGEVLKVLVFLDISDPAMTFFPGSEMGLPETVQAPILKLLLTAESLHLAQAIQDLKMASFSIDVEVLEARNLILANDFGPLDSASPFEPFGAIPKLGASFFIGHAKIFSQPLSDLKVNLEWFGLPQTEGGLAEHYHGYDYVDGNDTFKARVSSLRDGRWFPLEDKSVIDLFQTSSLHPEDESVSSIRRISELDIKELRLDEGYDQDEPVEGFSNKALDGFMRLELCYPPIAFGHSEYPELVQASAMKSIKKRRLESPPNEPLVPTLKDVSINYSHRSQYSFKKGEDFHLFRIHPFGTELVNPETESEATLIPRYASGSTLILGVDKYPGSGTLSLLFQLNQETSVRHTQEIELSWYYRRNGTWRPMRQEQIVSDATNGLRRTGVIELDLSAVNDREDKDYWSTARTWIKCETSNGTSFLDLLVDIREHAVLASSINPEIREEMVMPPQSIESLVSFDKRVSAIEQHYPSFGGRTKEEDELFYTRVSERLRHRNRAVSNWDYERLLLEEFEDIERVKCLNHVSLDGEIRPGSVIITAIPKLFRSKNNGFQFGYFSSEKLALMSTFLQRRCPNGVEVTVVNPIYEKVRVKMNVKYTQGYDPLFYSKKLNAEISDLLSPWRSGARDSISFGQSVHSSTVLSFIESQDYVDYILNFSLFHVIDGIIVNQAEAKMAGVEVKPSTDVSILVSDDSHQISSLDSEHMTDTAGINEMMIGTDFLVDMPSDNAVTGLNFLTIGKNFKIADSDAEKTAEKATFKFALRNE